MEPFFLFDHSPPAVCVSLHPSSFLGFWPNPIRQIRLRHRKLRICICLGTTACCMRRKRNRTTSYKLLAAYCSSRIADRVSTCSSAIVAAIAGSADSERMNECILPGHEKKATKKQLTDCCYLVVQEDMSEQLLKHS